MNYTVRMTNVPADGATTQPIFQVGPTAGPFVAADPASTFSSDGTITIVVPTSAIGNPAPGQNLTGFLTRITADVVAATITPDNMPDSLAPSGSYTLVGNNPFCRPNAAPVAALSASPLSGVAPLLVNFDASASSDPDTDPPPDTIASYTFNFGDGTPPVTQSTPTIQHTYNNPGSYRATVRVTDSRGKPSENTAGVNIDVDAPYTNTNTDTDTDANSNAAPTPAGTPSPTPCQTPAAPTNLVATAISSSQIGLSWVDNSNNETGFRIQRSTNGINFSIPC